MSEQADPAVKAGTIILTQRRKDAKDDVQKGKDNRDKGNGLKALLCLTP